MAIPKNCKRLAEVDFPLVPVARYSTAEKQKKTGTVAAIHVWWARRPLASSRAMNLACLVPDPADPDCPTELRQVIASALDRFDRSTDITKSGRSETKDGSLSESRNRPERLQKRLLNFIGMFANWDVRADRRYVECARSLVQGCNGGIAPVVLDPFAGGGSIPLEAMRIGASPLATDLNPIPYLLNRLQLEHLPNAGDDFLSKVRKEAEAINTRLAEEFAELYPVPKDLRGREVPIGYICARTVKCEGAGCGQQFPLLTSPWIVKCKGQNICYTFRRGANGEVEVGMKVDPASHEVPAKTVNKGDASCPVCNHVTPRKAVQRQLRATRGGSCDSRLLAVIGTPINEPGRTFRLPTPDEIDSRNIAKEKLQQILEDETRRNLRPSETLPPAGTLGFRVQPYGMTEWADIYSPKQLLTQMRLVEEVSRIDDEAVKSALAFVVSKFPNKNSTLSNWDSNTAFFRAVFNLQTIQMVWDFVEIVPFTLSGGPNFMRVYKSVEEGIRAATIGGVAIPGARSVISDATSHSLPDGVLDGFLTDPPYYDKVPYSNLSNFFLVWLKRMIHIDGLSDGLAERSNEVIMDKQDTDANGKTKSAEWYERMMGRAFSEGRRMIKPDGVGYVVYADKTTEGWATALTGLVDAGWTITGSWPIASEMSHRLRAQRSAALKTSVHIVIRPRENQADVGEWGEIIDALPPRIAEWLARLNAEGVVGADAIYSCIGPAMELYSRYDSVERVDGTVVTISEFLEVLWNTVASEALKLLDPTGGSGSIESEARFALMVLWTLRQSRLVDLVSGDILDEEGREGKADVKPTDSALPFDTARLLSQAIGADMDEMEKTGLLERKNKSGSVLIQLLSPANRRHKLLGQSNRETTSPGDGESTQLKLGESVGQARTRAQQEVRAKKADLPVLDTRLDRLHQAMLLHADGNTSALDHLLNDVISGEPTTWQLANTLNTLYPQGSWERSKIEGVIARNGALNG